MLVLVTLINILIIGDYLQLFFLKSEGIEQKKFQRTFSYSLLGISYFQPHIIYFFKVISFKKQKNLSII